MENDLPFSPNVPDEGTIPAGDGELFVREIGEGQPIIVLHGGPDFDHNYLLPEMDRLADMVRLIYYDQRGRGKSGGVVRPEDVTLESEMADLERVREHFRLESAAILGHSWGGLLAMEYATHHPERVSHLILMNSAPASHGDLLLMREDRRKNAAGDLEQLAALRTTASYQEGDLETDAAYYRIHFRAALRRPEHVESVVKRLRANVTKEGIVRARAIEDRLYEQTWFSAGYNLLPRFEGLSIPTLVLHGEHDFVPIACAAHVAEAIPGARLVLLPDCGHFSYLECPDGVRSAIVSFFAGT